MRRGLIAWSKAELPESALETRMARVRKELAAEALDALVLYTNNTRPGAVSWLTAFVPYWAEGLLVVPRDGDPLLTMAFSNRVVGWGKGVSHVARFEGVPRIGLAAGQYLTELGAKAVGVADLDTLRQAVAADLAEAAAGARLSDATALFRRARATAVAPDIALAVTAATIARRALGQMRASEGTIGETLAAVEGDARLAGAEEVYLAAAPDLDTDTRLRRIEGTAKLGRSFALRATVAYKGSWVRMTRTVCAVPEDEAVLARARDSFAAASAGLPGVEGFAGFRSWLIEGCRMAQPLDPLCGSAIAEPAPIAPGSLVTVQAILGLEGRTIAIAAPVLIGAEGLPSGILVQPIF
jgi:hypothetical protein